MKHVVKLLTLSNKNGYPPIRKFTAIIDEVQVIGHVKYIALKSLIKEPYKCAYRFKFPKELVKHPDYKDIRRELLQLMVKRDTRMEVRAVRQEMFPGRSMVGREALNFKTLVRSQNGEPTYNCKA